MTTNTGLWGLPRRALRRIEYRAADRFLWESRFRRIPEPKLRGAVPYSPATQDRILRDLQQAGVRTRDLDVDAGGFQDYLAKARYDRFPRYYGGGAAAAFPEKALEHYLAARLLELGPSDLYVDVANAGSPAPGIYGELYGCEVYRQDLRFPPGLRERAIGGDAGDMPVPDRFASKLGLHCSFEHFEGDADSRFIREAGRVLRPGGRLCILPLYLHDVFAVQTDPACLPPRGLRFDEGAVVHAARGWGERHGRFYDVPQFMERVVAQRGLLTVTVWAVSDPGAVAPGCHVKFIGVFEKG